MAKGLFSKIDEFLEPGEELGETDIPSPMSHMYFWNYVVGVGVLLLVVASVPLSGMIMGMLPVSLPFGSFTFLPLAVLPLGYIAWTDIKRRFNMFHFTDRKVVSESGILSKNFNSIQYNDIVDVTLEQTFLERLFDCGHLRLSTAGSNTSEIRLYGLRDPEEYKVRVDSSRKEGKTAFGTEAGNEAEDELLDDDGIGQPSEEGGDEIQVEEAGEAAPSDGAGGGVGTDELEKRLVQIEQQKEQLEQQHQRGQLGEEEYRKRWFVLEGRKKEVMQHLDRQETG
ncbi:MAG: PH domain-containing protein [Candidatus Nanohaloarchaea archaeon]|nr:PH domain-containing protein [Candidatus Nanohaloarchaea archaeon]